MADLSKSMPADDAQALRLATAMLLFLATFITKSILYRWAFARRAYGPNRLTKGHGTPSRSYHHFCSHKERAYALETVFYPRQIDGCPPG
jgi:hypothetical protein